MDCIEGNIAFCVCVCILVFIERQHLVRDWKNAGEGKNKNKIEWKVQEIH